MSTVGDRNCPRCGRPVERGETECPNCGEVLAMGPFGSSDPRHHYYAGQLLALGALLLPALGALSALVGIGMWTMHGDRDATGQIILSAALLTTVGYLYHGTFITF